MGGWVGRGRGGRHLGEQTQVLLANGHKRLSQLSLFQRQKLLSWLPDHVGAVKSTSTASRILSAILRISARTIEATVQHLRENGNAPCIRPVLRRSETKLVEPPRQVSEEVSEEAQEVPTPPGADVAEAAAQQSAAPVAIAYEGRCGDRVAQATPPGDRVPEATLQGSSVSIGFRNLLRVCVFMSSHGVPKDLLPGLCNLVIESKGDVGMAHHNRRFIGVVEDVCDDLVSDATKALCYRPLPATGVPADCELICDGGTVGSFSSRAGDTVLLVGVIISVPEAPYSQAVLVDIVNEGADARQAATMHKLDKSFREALGQPLQQWIKERCAVTCGDGAYVPGGEAARHASTGVFRALWHGMAPRDMWDLFHRVDKAGTRALHRSPLAKELFHLLKRLRDVFGLGQGRFIDKAVTAFLGLDYKVPRTPAGHRKLGYLCGVPERFLEKFESLYYAMMVRMSHSLDQRGSHSFRELKSWGEQLSNISLLTFSHGLAVVMKNHIAQLVLSSQSVRDLPWMRWRRLNAAPRHLRTHAAVLQRWRQWLRVLVLIAPFLLPKDLRCWWAALCFSASGRQVLAEGSQWHLGAFLFSALWTGDFRKCALLAAVPAPPAGTHLVHPTCQCGVRPQPAPGSGISRRGGGLLRDTSTVTLRRVARQGPQQGIARQGPQVSAPWWVSRTLYRAAELRDSARLRDPFLEPPRWQSFTSVDRGLVRQRRCRVIALVQETFQRLDTGLSELQRLWVDMAREIADYGVGDVGVSAEMRQVLGAVDVALSLEDVVAMPRPTPRHCAALREAYVALRPDLARRPFPPADFPMTPSVRRWPHVEGMVTLYQRWWLHVHKAGQSARYRASWREVQGYTVAPVMLTPVMVQVGKMVTAAGTFRGQARERWRAAMKVGFDVQAFLVGSQTSEFVVAVGALSLPPSSAAVRSVGTLRGKFHRGRLVVVKRIEAAWKQQAIAAACEQDVSFSANCWHMNRFFAFCRRLGSTEAPCESWVSGLKYLWNPVAGGGMTSLARRLRCFTAGLRGDSADDALLEPLARRLLCGQSDLPRQGAFRAVETYRRRAQREAEQNGLRGLLDVWAGVRDRVRPMDEVKESRHWYKWVQEASLRKRKRYEPVQMETADLALCQRQQKLRRATLPLFSNTRKQWELDMRFDTRRERPQEWAAASSAQAKKAWAKTVTASANHHSQTKASSAIGREEVQDADDPMSSSASSSTSTSSDSDKDTESSPGDEA